MNVLIVDDDYGSRHLLLINLSPYAKCDTAQTGMEAVYMFRTALWTKDAYDLICLDIDMPIMDGHTALEKIRDIEKEEKISPRNYVKVIMTTGDEDPHNIAKSMRLKADKYIKKPIRKKKLLAMIQSMNLIKS